jgi:preprotein translocase subunit Sec63
VIAIIVLVPLTAAAWPYFDSRGLPDPQSLAPFAPKSVATVSDPCLKSPAPVIAIPYDSIGSNMHRALSAAEASEDDPGVMSGTIGQSCIGKVPELVCQTSSEELCFVSRIRVERSIII